MPAQQPSSDMDMDLPHRSNAATADASDPVTQIAVVAFDRISPFHLSVPCVVFGEAHRGAPRFAVEVCSAEGPQLQSSAGFKLALEADLASLARAQIIVVPSWRDPSESPPAMLLNALRAADQRGALIVGLCLGAYVLAHAGLLDGRSATTHWAYAEDFGQRFPAVRLDPERLYVADDHLLTSAGTAAGIDCCLHLLRQLGGADVANRAARRLVVPPHRQGNQAQFVQQPVAKTRRDSQLAALLDWLRSQLHTHHDLDSLAQRAAMSRRTFTRRFRAATGTTVGEWLLNQRLMRAQQLLENSALGIDQVAQQCGFGSTSPLRQHFQQRFGVSPSQWRNSFNQRSQG